MIINLSPASPRPGKETLTVVRQGDALICNGQEFDFSALPDGATLPHTAMQSDFFDRDVERVDGDLIISLRIPCGPNAPAETRFPQSIIDPPDGPLELPPYTIEEHADV